MVTYSRYVLISALLLLLSVDSVAAVDVYDFDTAAQRHRYQLLSEELRCPKCQNQNLAGSDSQIAGDLRRELHRLLLEGKTDREIKTYMVDRYGDFVLYKPRFQKSTLVLWVMPVILFITGLVVLTFIVRRRKVKVVSEHADTAEMDHTNAPMLSEQEQLALNRLLLKKSDTDNLSKDSSL
jgi:cytochrome c-type biogenesis protein CcmH